MPTMVPALLGAAVILAVLAVCAFLFGAFLESWRVPLTPRWHRYVALTVGGICVALVVGLLITACTLNSKHWNDSCHRLHGQLIADGCYKPTKKISVP